MNFLSRCLLPPSIAACVAMASLGCTKVKTPAEKRGTEDFIELVTVGNPGNEADAGNSGDASRFGAVPYEFKIGKYEVSLEQYVAFLNAIAATDPNELYNPEMGKDLNSAGIRRSGESGSFSYSVIGSGQRPVTFVSWFDAARFCNWLHNGRPNGEQDTDTTEGGAYTLKEAISGGRFGRNAGAKFWIPSEDEWYKAAFHCPRENSGPSDNYYLYPTASDKLPGNVIGPEPLVNQANFITTVYSVTQFTWYVAEANYLTDVGSYSGSPSSYGTFDQGGNVSEWIDAVPGEAFRRLRGGSWLDDETDLRSTNRGFNKPDFEFSNCGFRVASAALQVP